MECGPLHLEDGDSPPVPINGPRDNYVELTVIWSHSTSRMTELILINMLHCRCLHKRDVPPNIA